MGTRREPLQASKWSFCLGVFMLLGWWVAAPAHAHERDYFFQRIGSNDGLSQNGISVIFQGRRGFIWLGTQGGLHRFDGYAIKRFHHNPSHPGSLPNNLITALASASNGRLWVGSVSGGLVRFDPERNRAERPPGHWAARLGTIDDLRGGDGRRLWIGTPSGIYASDPPYDAATTLWSGHADAHGNARLALCPDGSAFALSDGTLLALGRSAQDTRALHTGLSLTTLACVHGNRLLVGATSGLYRVDPQSGEAQHLWPVPEAADNTATSIRAIAEDHRHRLWLAVPQLGLVRLSPDLSSARVLQRRRNVPGSLPEAAVTHLFVDRSGLLWVGTTTRGAAYTNPDGTPFQYIFDADAHGDPASANNVRSIYEDPGGRFWVGFNGAGLRLYDPGQQHFTDLRQHLAHLLTSRQLDHLYVYSIRRADRQHLWLGTNHGVIAIDMKTLHARRPAAADFHASAGMPDPDSTIIESLLHARDGSWWLGLMPLGLLHYVPGHGLHWYRHQPDAAPDKGLADNSVIALTQDASGRVWIGTTDGLSMYDPASGRMRSFREHADRADSLSGRVVPVIFVDRHQHVWVGTQTGLNRLIKVDADGAHFRRYLVGSQLPDNTIYCLREDAAGQLWMSTNLGVARFDPATGAHRVFGMRDGLQGMEFNTGSCLEARDGSLMFGGINGISRVRPDGLHDSNYLPPVAITGVEVGAGDNAPHRTNGRVTMNASDLVVRFEFAAMDFAAPRENRFQYRLLGFDRKWITAGTHNSATYTNLDPGRYRFQVRGSNSEGRFGGPIRSLALTVVPPWWQAWPMQLVYLLGGLLLIAGVTLAVRARRANSRLYQRQLRERESRLSTALWGSGDEFWDVDLVHGRLHRLHARQRRGIGRRESSLSVEDWRNYVVHPDDLALVQDAVDRHLEGSTDHFEAEFRVRGLHHRWIWIRSRGKVVERDPSGHPIRLSGTAHDVTRLRAEERERRIAAEVIHNMAEAVTVTDLDFHFMSINDAFTRMTGYNADEVIGSDAALLDCAQQSEEHYRRAREEVSRHGRWRGELWQKRKSGGEFLCWIEMSEVLDAAGVRTHYVAVMSDITNRKRAEQELRYLANYDMLTGLPNRTLLGERLGEAILRARRTDMRVAVLYLDLDRFKHVNDSMGHATGDRLLKAAGARLRRCLRENDTVARVGGDEFTLVLGDVDEVTDVEAVAAKIIDAFTEPMLLDTRQEILISPSIGIALYPDHSPIPDDLIKHADTAMYQAKEKGRNTWMLYTEAMDADARLRATMASALRRALERNELSVVYQPKMALDEQRIIGVEALLRWHNARLGNVPPSVFIPLAEESGLIVDIGRFVIERACADLTAWRQAGLDDLTMAVNLSMAQLQRTELADALRRVLQRFDLPPSCMELELTESMVMGNVEQSMRTLGELKAIGVALTIDDFGTGYSSMAYLKRLPINTLKIDQTFIDDITSDPDDEAITATIITIAHSLGLNVVAEGVENAEQVEYLEGHDCDIIQGHWLSPPRPAYECMAYCMAHREAHDRAGPATHPVEST